MLELDKVQDLLATKSRGSFSWQIELMTGKGKEPHLSIGRFSDLQITDLTFEKALQIAISIETANQNARYLEAFSDTWKCFNVNDGPSEAQTIFKEDVRTCHQCKVTKHTSTKYKFTQEKCCVCQSRHIARTCLSKSKTNQGDRRPTERERRQGPDDRSHKVHENKNESKWM